MTDLLGIYGRKYTHCPLVLEWKWMRNVLLGKSYSILVLLKLVSGFKGRLLSLTSNKFLFVDSSLLNSNERRTNFIVSLINNLILVNEKFLIL